MSEVALYLGSIGLEVEAIDAGIGPYPEFTQELTAIARSALSQI